MISPTRFPEDPKREWEIIVEPHESARILVVITAYGI
jgi:hypothetical protein